MNKSTQLNTRLLGVLPNDDVLQQCIHCGMCLAVCPTYEMTKNERSSPRGRIKLIKSVARGEMEITPTFAEEMNFCLDCQACETACPAGVKYGSMVEAARVEIDNTAYRSWFYKFVKNFLLSTIVGSRSKLKFVSRLLRIYQNSFLRKLLHKSGVMKLFSANLEEIDKLSPTVSRQFSDDIIPAITTPKGEVKYKTAFLSGCLMNVMFAEINKDTVDVLQSCDCEVFTPKDQICCGSLQAHSGDFDTAKKLAKHTIDVFSDYQFDYMISNSAGCGAFMKEYAHILHDDEQYSERARQFSKRVKDISEFLTEANLPENLKNTVQSITYHDACHLAHTQKITEAPRKMIKAIPGINYQELEEASWCCGSAGTYNIVHYKESMIILERKMENIRKTNSKIVLTGNPGCLAQLRYGAKRFGVDVEVMHPVSFVRGALNKLD
jgi:glycolate oxidase iron-sulfur subunit